LDGVFEERGANAELPELQLDGDVAQVGRAWNRPIALHGDVAHNLPAQPHHLNEGT
jgi:hypothetical protein